MKNKDEQNEFEKTLYLALKKHNWMLPVTDEQVKEFESNSPQTQSAPPELSEFENFIYGIVDPDIKNFLGDESAEDLYRRKVATERGDNPGEAPNEPSSFS